MTFPLVYEINTRCWLAELSEKAGRSITLATVSDAEFDLFERNGFTHIWLMGVWTLGARGRAWSRNCYGSREKEFGCADPAGSPYAIVGYTTSRKLGGDTALAAFRRKLHSRGMRLVLDFVPNHTALDHPWVREHPDFYITATKHREGFTKPFRAATRWYAHGACGHGSPWVDTLQLNYRNSALHAAMVRELQSVSDRCDAVRCDMAMLVLRDVFENTWKELPRPADAAAGEFWTDAMAAVRSSRKDFQFIAEVYWDLEQTLQTLGFDYTYDKRLYDRIIANDAGAVTDYLSSLTPEFISRSVHFIENHDEPRIASLFGPERHRAAALLVAALPGMRLFHEGQLTGTKTHANVHFARRGAESINEPLANWYERLFESLQSSTVGHGEGMLLKPRAAWESNSTHQNFVIVQWHAGGISFDVAAVNVAPDRSQCFAPIQHDHLGSYEWRAVDLLGTEVHDRAGAELARSGFYLDVPGYSAQLFHFTPLA